MRSGRVVPVTWRVLAPQVAGAVVLLGVGSMLGLGVTTLAERATSNRERAYRAASLVSDLRVIDGLEWRAVATLPGEFGSGTWRSSDPEPPIVRKVPSAQGSMQHEAEDLSVMEQTRVAVSEQAREDLAMASTAADSQLRHEVTAYLDSMARLFAAVEDGDRDLVHRIDDELTDPGFDTSLALATGLAGRELERAARTEAAVRQMIWAGTVSGTVLIGVLAWVGVHTRLRRRQRREQSRLYSRFRSLVESSHDVITVVAGEDDLTVMSPSLGGLAALVTAAPQRIRELLTGSALDRWCSEDELLRRRGGTRRLELILERRDGSRMWVEAYGSLLADNPRERVWTWRDVTERKELELRLAHQAQHDPLTGAGNRALFLQRITEAVDGAERSAGVFSVLYCDLDDFKPINDRLGHACGDELLRLVVQRISGCLGEQDTLARLGGDEFAVLLDGADGAAADRARVRILGAVCLPATLGADQVIPAMSVGVATWRPGQSVDELMRHADGAMYADKGATPRSRA